MNTNKPSRERDVIAAIQTAAGMNFAMSFLVPVKKGEMILNAAFLYPTGSFSPTRTRPFASILLEPQSGAMLEYRSAYISDFADSERCPMTMKLDYSVPARTAAEQRALLEKLDGLYPSVRKLPWKDGWTDGEKTAAAEYRQTFFKAVPETLLPFYEALSPEFYVWLREENP